MLTIDIPLKNRRKIFALFDSKTKKSGLDGAPGTGAGREAPFFAGGLARSATSATRRARHLSLFAAERGTNPRSCTSDSIAAFMRVRYDRRLL
jgi:hypothetical protein